MGLRVVPVHAKSDGDFEAAFLHLIQQNVGALVVSADAFFVSRRVRLSGARVAAPLTKCVPVAAVCGGWRSRQLRRERLGRVPSGRHLRRPNPSSAKPSDIPVQQPTRFELVINSKTATALGLPIPPNFLARADEVIE